MDEARMDGTPEQQLRWRVKALREALTDIMAMTKDDAIVATVDAAIGVDNYNAKVMSE